MELGQSPTRQEILVLLKNSGGMTVDQLKRELGISAMGVRQHVAVLERDGLIESVKRRGQMDRPARVYTLTAHGDEMFPRSYDNLAITLLDIISALDGDEKVDTVFRMRMEKLRENYAARLTAKDLPGRLAELTQALQERGYMAEYGQRSGGFYLIEHNCTMARVAERYPVACQYERILFESLLGAEVRQEQCIAKGDACCSYYVTTAARADEAESPRGRA